MFKGNGDFMADMEIGQSAQIHPDQKSGASGPAPSLRASTDTAAGPARLFSQLKEALAEFDQDGASSDNATRALELLLKNADILMRNFEYRLATHILRSVLVHHPGHVEALMKMGICLRACGRHDESLKCFKAVAKQSGSVEAKVFIAEAYYLMELDDMAIAAYRDVLRGVIKDGTILFDVYKNIGNIHVRQSDFEAAEEFYDKAYNLNPESDVLMVNYGTLEIQRDRLAEAVDRFRRSVEINSENDRGWVGLALVHRQMGDIELAWANLERALDINPNNRTALRLTVDWGVADHRFGATVRCLQEYISGAGGEDAEMCFMLAKIFAQTGRLSEARIELERVLALDPDIEGGVALKRILDRELRKRAQSAGWGADATNESNTSERA